MFIMKSGKRQITEEIELPNENACRKEHYLRILKVDNIRQAEMKEKK